MTESYGVYLDPDAAPGTVVYRDPDAGAVPGAVAGTGYADPHLVQRLIQRADQPGVISRAPMQHLLDRGPELTTALPLAALAGRASTPGPVAGYGSAELPVVTPLRAGDEPDQNQPYPAQPYPAERYPAERYPVEAYRPSPGPDQPADPPARPAAAIASGYASVSYRSPGPDPAGRNPGPRTASQAVTGAGRDRPDGAPNPLGPSPGRVPIASPGPRDVAPAPGPDVTRVPLLIDRPGIPQRPSGRPPADVRPVARPWMQSFASGLPVARARWFTPATGTGDHRPAGGPSGLGDGRDAAVGNQLGSGGEPGSGLPVVTPGPGSAGPNGNENTSSAQQVASSPGGTPVRPANDWATELSTGWDQFTSWISTAISPLPLVTSASSRPREESPDLAADGGPGPESAPVGADGGPPASSAAVASAEPDPDAEPAPVAAGDEPERGMSPGDLDRMAGTVERRLIRRLAIEAERRGVR